MPHLYQEIAESIRRQIAAGEIMPGDRLPAVRRMARQWSCTPGTVNRAYRELAEEGLVSGRRGSGTRVLESSLIANRPELEWANLVNRAEQFLLEVLSSGHTLELAQSALSVAVSRWLTLQEQSPIAASNLPPSQQLRFAGSHDLAVELLTHRLRASDSSVRLEVEFTGSLGGLIALAQGEADVAGIHLWDAATASYNLPFIRRVLPGRRLALVTLILRQLGLVVPAGNPQQIEGLSDLVRPTVRWMNRQPGSGTRIWLDEQLRQAKIEPADIQGYDREGATHMAVAQALQSGSATAGLSIKAAARAYGLDFIPLTDEPYQLVIPEGVWESAAWQTVLTIIESDRFVAAVNDLGGYNTDSTGELTWV